MSEQWKNLNLINVIYTKVSIYKKNTKKLGKKSIYDNHVIKYLKSIFFWIQFRQSICEISFATICYTLGWITTLNIGGPTGKYFAIGAIPSLVLPVNVLSVQWCSLCTSGISGRGSGSSLVYCCRQSQADSGRVANHGLTLLLVPAVIGTLLGEMNSSWTHFTSLG